METYDDTYYIRRIEKGDVRCYAALVNKYSRPVYSLIFKIVRNREDAEELAQDVFVKVYRSLSGFKGDCSFSTWLYRIAYNSAVSSTRQVKHEWLAFDDTIINNVSEEDVSQVLGEVDDADQLRLLEAALEQLPAEEHLLILLFYRQKKTVEELATITGWSVSNVKTKLHRIRKKLYVLIKRMEDI